MSCGGESRAAILWVTIALLVVAVAVYWFAVGRFRGAGYSGGPLEIYGTVPEFNLTERGGQRVTQEDLRGHVWVADFIFTRCGSICPMLTARMARLQRDLGAGRQPGLRLVSFSVDPEFDTPEVLRAYAEQHRASATGWWFLTGDRWTLFKLIGDGFGLPVERQPGGADADPNQLITHSGKFVVVDSELRIRGYFSGLDDEGVDQARRAAELLMREAR